MKHLIILLLLISSFINNGAGMVISEPLKNFSSTLKADPFAPMTDAEFLAWKKTASPLEIGLNLVAHSEQFVLSDVMTNEAAALLSSDDMFVRAAGEWALSLRIGNENKDDKVIWPKVENPDWFVKWYKIPLEERIEMDWCRQAISAGISNNPEKLIEQIDEIVSRIDTQIKNSAFLTSDLKMVNNVRKEISQQLNKARTIAPSDKYDELVREYWVNTRRLLRPVVFANKVIDFDSLIFYTRYAPHHKPNVCGILHNATYKPGGDITILKGLDDVKSVNTLINGKLEQGHLHGMDLHFDGDKVVFGYGRQLVWPPPRESHYNNRTNLSWATELRQSLEPVSLYEMNTDGSGLKRLTSHPVWSDTEPVYCPNDDIAFSSERSAHSPPCDDEFNDVSDVNLYLLQRKDHTIRRLTNHRDIDMTPRLLDNGLLAYLRWEYQERHFNEIHSIWTIHTDGRNADALYKQHIPKPYALREVRSIPNSNKLVAIAAGHHCYSRGPIIVVDPQKGGNNPEGMEIMTPGVLPQEGSVHETTRPVKFGGVKEYRGFYRNPYPLSENVMLASYSYASPYCDPYKGANPQYKSQVEANGFGIYLIDAYGNKELIYRDPFLSCVDVAPYKKRNRPATVPDMVYEDENYATCVVTNVYEGVHEDVDPGSIKYIRVSEHLPTPYDKNGRALKFAFGAKYWSSLPSVTRWTSVREIGLVPVEEDGSAHFKVPVADNASVYFQALDENYMEVIRMRSSVSFQPGELRSCTGCHETQNYRAPAPSTVSATRKPPVLPEKPAWGYAPIDYETMIQPIFDNNCIQCHDGQHQKTNLDLTNTKIAVKNSPEKFNQSYISILGPSGLGRDDESLVFLNDRFSDGAITLPKEFGSHKSKLTKTMLDEHHGVHLTEDEWYALVTWVDYNAPYHGRLVNKYPADGSLARREVYEWPDPWGNPAKIPAFKGRSQVPEYNVDTTLMVSDPSQGKIYRINMEGNVVWSYDAVSCSDIQMLPNGHILIADEYYVKEVDRTGRAILSYKNSNPVHSCQQLPDGYFLVADDDQSRLLLLDRKMKKEKEIVLAGNADHRSIQQLRLGPQGTYFLAEGTAQTAGEYSTEGELLRSIPFGNDVHSIAPLNNGDVIIGGVGGIQIVDRNNRITWSLKPGDIPEMDLETILDLIWLPGGNLLAVNKSNKTSGAGALKIFEVNPEKEIVRYYNENDVLLQPVSLAIDGVDYHMPSSGNYMVFNETKKQLMICSEDGTIVNQINTESCNDLQQTKSGNFLYADGNFIKEITPEGQFVGQYANNQKVLSFARLINGQTISLNLPDNTLTFFGSDYTKLRTFTLNMAENDREWGRIRETVNGTLLVTEGDGYSLKEFDLNGSFIRKMQYPVKITAMTADYAGNTITGHQNEIRIISPENKLVWKLTPEEVPEVNMTDISSIKSRNNGNLLICSGGNSGKDDLCLFEITRKKKVVRKFPETRGEKYVVAMDLK